MKNIRSLFCLLLILTGVGARAGDAAGDLAVIVNKNCKLDDVSLADLTKYFLADKAKMPDGTKIVIVMQDTGRAEREAALKGIYKMNETEYNDHFVEAMFTGAVAAAPKSLPSGAALKKYVADAPGGLGYVQGGEVDDTIKVLKIEGKAPGDAGYKLKLK